MKMHNFNAGPCVLPREAVESAIEAIRNFDNTGIGLLEISHRTPGWERIMAETEQLWRELLNIPEEYEVLFLGGGASTQFFHVPANLLNKKAAYLQTGVWAKKAAKGAGKWAKSTKDKRMVLAIAPTSPAAAAILRWELNIKEKPKTPQKLAKRRQAARTGRESPKAGRSPGLIWRAVAITQPVPVAIKIMKMA